MKNFNKKILYNRQRKHDFFYLSPARRGAKPPRSIATTTIFCHEEIKKSSRRILQNIGRKRLGEYIKAISKNCFASDLRNFARKISTFF